MRLHLANDPWNDSNSEALQNAMKMLAKNENQNLFAGYFFDINSQASGTLPTT